MGRYDLTDKEYALIEDLVDYIPSRGAKPKLVRETLSAILWILCTGAPWRDLPAYYPAWKTVYDRFRIYADNGIIDAVLERLMKHANENRKMLLELIAIDGTYVKAHRHAAGAKKRRANQSRITGRTRTRTLKRRIHHKNHMNCASEA